MPDKAMDEGGIEAPALDDNGLEDLITNTMKTRLALEGEIADLRASINKSKDTLAAQGLSKGAQNRIFSLYRTEQGEEGEIAKKKRDADDRAEMIMRNALGIGPQMELFS